MDRDMTRDILFVDRITLGVCTVYMDRDMTHGVCTVYLPFTVTVRHLLQ